MSPALAAQDMKGSMLMHAAQLYITLAWGFDVTRDSSFIRIFQRLAELLPEAWDQDHRLLLAQVPHLRQGRFQTAGVARIEVSRLVSLDPWRSC